MKTFIALLEIQNMLKSNRNYTSLPILITEFLIWHFYSPEISARSDIIPINY